MGYHDHGLLVSGDFTYMEPCVMLESIGLSKHEIGNRARSYSSVSSSLSNSFRSPQTALLTRVLVVGHVSIQLPAHAGMLYPISPIAITSDSN